MEPLFENFRSIGIDIKIGIYIYNCYFSQRSLKGLLQANCCAIVKKMHHFQSDFRKYDSTETALLKVQNHILLSMDRQEVCFLVLLDLSSAFDTIDHKLLLTQWGRLFESGLVLTLG